MNVNNEVVVSQIRERYREAKGELFEMAGLPPKEEFFDAMRRLAALPAFRIMLTVEAGRRGKPFDPVWESNFPSIGGWLDQMYARDLMRPRGRAEWDVFI